MKQRIKCVVSRFLPLNTATIIDEAKTGNKIKN